MVKVDIPDCPFCGSRAKESVAKEDESGDSFGFHGLKTVYCQSCSASAARKDWMIRCKINPDFTDEYKNNRQKDMIPT